MMNQPADRPHILFLFSDTGGGHRSAAEAIIEALHLSFGDQITCEMVDVLKDYAPKPLNLLPHFYPQMVRMPSAWGVGYRLSNGQRRTRWINTSFWPYIRTAARSVLENHPSDLIVSVHPLANTPFLNALAGNHPPFITIVTDLVSTHAIWYDRRAELCLVPTEPARARALACGLAPTRVKVVGLPVSERFRDLPRDRAKLRTRLGWPPERLVLLLVGGGEGMGPLERIATRIDQAELPVVLAVVTGRNRPLRERLAQRNWSTDVFIYGFVQDMPDFMAAADVLVTKAGPGTICEAFTAGLPLVIYNRLPGQEDGNVTYVVSNGAGVWAPNPDKVVAVLKTWVKTPEVRLAAAKASRELARPDSARAVANILAGHVLAGNDSHSDQKETTGYRSPSI